MILINTFLFILIIIYCGVLIWLIFGNLKSYKNRANARYRPVSVIISIRNGEDALPDLIQDLLSQDYKGEYEVILVDDDSDDDTANIIKEISKQDNHFIFQSSSKGKSSLQFKKRALDAGIEIAKHEWLLFSDVDCRLPSSWITGMASYFQPDNDYVIGHSNVKMGNKILNIFQSLDFFLLLVSARGAANLHCALACTGQNQAYRKSLYVNVGGFIRIKDQLQGDDSLFMNICKKWGKARIIFADDSKCHVYSRKEKKWLPLLIQRLRWSGDANVMWNVNLGFYVILCGFFLLHFKLMILFFFSIFNYQLFLLLATYLLIKFIFEFSLYIVGCQYLQNSTNFFKFLIWYFIHIPYVAIIGIASFFHKKIEWKGRKINYSN